jgi:hypothetical protein
MLRTKCFALAIAVSSIATVAPALAQEGGFGKTGQIMISAERLFGLTFPSVVTEDGDSHDKTTQSRTNIALLFTPLSAVQSPYEIPRAAIDFNVASGFTVGGAIGFMSSTGKTKFEPAMPPPRPDRDDATITMFLFTPRIGYVLPLSPMFGFWPRAGITYYSISAENTSTGNMPVTIKQTTNGFAVDIEPMFVITPVNHFGITVGPTVDLPLSGTRSVTSTPADPTPPADDKVKYTSFGLNVGLLGYF